MTFNSVNEKLLFYKIPTVLFSLIPLFLITGPFLSDLSISLISLLFLIYCIKEKNFSYFKNKYFYFFLIFWVYLLLNILINNFNTNSLGTTIVYVRYGIFVTAIVALLRTDEKFIKYFFYCIFICFTALVFDGFYQYLTGENILGFKKPASYRVSSFFQDEMILGSYLSRIWPIFFGLSILVLNQKNKLFYFLVIIFILSEVLIFLSGDRTAFFYINLSAIFVILFSQKLLKLRLFTLLSSILLLIIISFINPTARERVFDQTFSQMNLMDGKVNEQEGIYIFSKQHTHHYITAYKMFVDNKFLGVGVKNFRNLCDDEKYIVSDLSCSTHPHNIYIQILAETGIIGFLFLLMTLIYFCIHIFRHVMLKFNGKYLFNDFEICILSGLAIYLWPVVPTFNVFNNWVNITMIINLPFLIWSINLSTRNRFNDK
tara:strand:+ start:1700 stop:2989 length:1290 start_codon:yes stop_codon:yes gene_type:complete